MSSRFVFIRPRLIPPRHLTLDLLLAYFSWLNEDDLLVCAFTSPWFFEPAQSFLLRRVHLNDTVQLISLIKQPNLRRYVRTIIAPADLNDIPIHNCRFPSHIYDHSTSTASIEHRTMAIQNLELIGRGFKRPLLSISRVPETVLAFSNTLRSFMMHDEADMTGDAYCNLLNALGRCKNLTHLTLPSGREFDDTQLERLHAPLSADRPRILCLQTLPTYYRHHLAWNTGASEARRWSWVFHENCPLDLQSVEELIVGNTGVALLLLPSMRASLIRLEFCAKFDARGSQVVFDGSPLILPRLQRLQFGFCKIPSTWILQAIRAPLIQEIIIQWKDGFGSVCIGDARIGLLFGEVSSHICALDPDENFPRCLKQIVFLGLSKNLDLSKFRSWFDGVFNTLKFRGVSFASEPLHSSYPVSIPFGYSDYFLDILRSTDFIVDINTHQY
ncbi:hypothetical protein F5879DRAFT_988035 [Lentinula edodes]|nr:hypothetical protein F5879DRAFT_988035 [Lentinula edodes]